MLNDVLGILFAICWLGALAGISGFLIFCGAYIIFRIFKAIMDEFTK